MTPDFRTWRAFDRDGRFLGMIEALEGHEYEMALALYSTPAVRLELEAGDEGRVPLSRAVQS